MVSPDLRTGDNNNQQQQQQHPRHPTNASTTSPFSVATLRRSNSHVTPTRTLRLSESEITPVRSLDVTAVLRHAQRPRSNQRNRTPRRNVAFDEPYAHESVETSSERREETTSNQGQSVS
jgi:hypothetical protein